jgi:hypothetical protein
MNEFRFLFNTIYQTVHYILCIFYLLFRRFRIGGRESNEQQFIFHNIESAFWLEGIESFISLFYSHFVGEKSKQSTTTWATFFFSFTFSIFSHPLNDTSILIHNKCIADAQVGRERTWNKFILSPSLFSHHLYKSEVDRVSGSFT